MGRPNLFHQVQPVVLTPSFYQLPIVDSEDLNNRERYLLLRRCNTNELTGMGAV